MIIVENLPVPLDRRVWQEACALRDAGWTISVICPKSAQFPLAFETIDDIEIFRHDLPLEASGRFAFLYEYAAALFHEFRLLWKVRRRRGFDVIQACNPPDLIFLVAAPFKLFGKRFVFDHHDVCPELFVAKFERRGFFHTLLLLAEKATFRTADLVISANETYRRLAISRGGKKPEDVVTVYSVPDKARIRRVSPNEALRAGAATVLGYVGIIADQDGVDHLVRCVHHLVADHGQRSIRAVVVGDGPALESVKRLAGELGVADHITFTGYLRGEDLLAALSTFDIGIIPDPVNEYNDKISMNKVFEYSALGISSVSYDLTETRRLLGEAGRYALGATPADLAVAAVPLIEDLELRLASGRRAKALADAQFDWDREAERYVAAYARLMDGDRRPSAAGA
ncbi:glycosyltransferase family 4 protein [Aureimonas phyllosphaerae]|uniref:Glycosyltransferase involved in cell wall biosynthesis n=1 Tax=Aureimonas phyllosphaerae TaxID=1166078 RepID=A0A7W6C1Z6_9HYPH|nr:glycosyltransferase family 4 protein [Aureimonas phyllosphaerae]MBB3938021.1 glycosyltransferase involved in cell wall biosynthesis [Aureimonas phyllosphaerae]MBB3962028.1 glycosyltransferase involved in cell wall biosynthesis [Aureimonas phyllosphaerae]